MGGAAQTQRKLVCLDQDSKRWNLVRICDWHNRSSCLFGAPVLVDLLNRKYGTNAQVVPYTIADRARALQCGRGVFEEYSHFATGDAIAYGQPKTALGKEIVFLAQSEYPEDTTPVPTVVFQVPSEYQDRSDVGLVIRRITSRDIVVDGGKTLFDFVLANLPSLDSLDFTTLVGALYPIVASVREFRFTIQDAGQRIRLVTAFPNWSANYYSPGPSTGVPSGLPIDEVKAGARYFHRIWEGAYAGILTISNLDWVHATHFPLETVGLVVHVPDADIRKFPIPER